MGLVHVNVGVKRDGGRVRRVRFLVDSGASYSVLPQKVWKALKLAPRRSLDFTLVDGTTIRRRVSDCRFVYEGIDAPSPVILGERNDEALLGTVTLESLGLVLNPFERTLRPMQLMLARAQGAAWGGPAPQSPARQVRNPANTSRRSGV